LPGGTTIEKKLLNSLLALYLGLIGDGTFKNINFDDQSVKKCNSDDTVVAKLSKNNRLNWYRV